MMVYSRGQYFWRMFNFTLISKIYQVSNQHKKLYMFHKPCSYHLEFTGAYFRIFAQTLISRENYRTQDNGIEGQCTFNSDAYAHEVSIIYLQPFQSYSWWSGRKLVLIKRGVYPQQMGAYFRGAVFYILQNENSKFENTTWKLILSLVKTYEFLFWQPCFTRREKINIFVPWIICMQGIPAGVPQTFTFWVYFWMDLS